jgi:hypothetical protein
LLNIFYNFRRLKINLLLKLTHYLNLIQMKKFYSLLVALLAVIAVSAENPTLFLRGGINNWGTGDAYQFTENDGVYTLKLETLYGEFKIADANWNPNNYGLKADVVPGGTYTLESNGGNLSVVADALSDVTLTFTLSTLELKVEGTEAVRKADFYLAGANIGEGEGWTITDDYKFETIDYDTYVIELPELSGEFKITTEGWGVGYAGNTAIAVGDNAVVKGADGNLALADGATLQNVRLTFTLSTSNLNVYVPDESSIALRNQLIGSYVGTDHHGWEYLSKGSSVTIVYSYAEDSAVEIEKGVIGDALSIDGLLSVGVANVYPEPIRAVVTSYADYEGYVGYITVPGQAAGTLDYYYSGVPYNMLMSFSAAFDSSWSWASGPTYELTLWVTEDGTIEMNPWAAMMDWSGDGSTWYYGLIGGYGAYDSSNTWHADTLSKSAGSVANIAVDENAPVEYFNLQGVRVANPANGLFIRRQGNTATKVLVK